MPIEVKHDQKWVEEFGKAQEKRRERLMAMAQNNEVMVKEMVNL